MVVDTIRKLIFYFINSKESNKIVVEETTPTEQAPTTETMSTSIVANDDVQSLYSIVENSLKGNVSIQSMYMQKSINDSFVFLQ